MRALDPWGDELQLIHYDQRGSGNTPLGDVQRVSFAGGVEDLEGLRRALGLERIQVLGHSAGAYLAALYAAEHPDDDSRRGAPQPRAAARAGADAALREDDVEPSHSGRRRRTQAPSRSPTEFRAGQPQALERHQLNTFIPFFNDRATVERVSLGFTEITAANVQQAPQRMMGSLGALDPIRKFAGIEAPTLVVHSELRPDPGRVEPVPGRHDPECRLRAHRGWQPLSDGRGRRATAEHGGALAGKVHLKGGG